LRRNELGLNIRILPGSLATAARLALPGLEAFLVAFLMAIIRDLTSFLIHASVPSVKRWEPSWPAQGDRKPFIN
jgi:hypothetical protein